MDLNKCTFDDLLTFAVSKDAKTLNITKEELDRLLFKAAKKEIKDLEKKSKDKPNDSIDMRTYRAALRIVEGDIVGAEKKRE